MQVISLKLSKKCQMLKFCGNEISYSIVIYLTKLHFSWTLFWNFLNLNIQIKKKIICSPQTARQAEECLQSLHQDLL